MMNVHPSKMELRFKDGENMYRVICQAVTDALSGKELIPNVSLMSEREERELEKNENAAARNLIPGSGINTPAKNGHGPEPFERRRLEAMGIREERPAYGEKKQESRWILPPNPLTRELPQERAQTQQPKECENASIEKAGAIKTTVSVESPSYDAGVPKETSAGAMLRLWKRKFRRRKVQLWLRRKQSRLRKKPLWQRRKRLLSRWKCSTTAFFQNPRESATA